MPSTSLPAAIVELYSGISGTHFGGTRPPIYLNQAPRTDTDGSQRRPPYVILYDDGLRPEYDSSFGGIVRGEVRLEAYALELDAASGVSVNSIVNGFRYGGGTPSQKLGLDFGPLPFAARLYAIHLMPMYDQTRYAGFEDRDGQRVHVREIRYQVIYGIKPTT